MLFSLCVCVCFPSIVVLSESPVAICLWSTDCALFWRFSLIKHFPSVFTSLRLFWSIRSRARVLIKGLMCVANWLDCTVAKRDGMFISLANRFSFSSLSFISVSNVRVAGNRFVSEKKMLLNMKRMSGELSVARKEKWSLLQLTSEQSAFSFCSFFRLWSRLISFSSPRVPLALNRRDEPGNVFSIDF